jgi:hypothetical protein
MNTIAPTYNLKMTFNGETFNKKTKNLRTAIMSLKPDVLHTEAFIVIKNGEYVFERKLNLLQMKKLFNNEDVMNAFMTNIIA